VLYDKFVIPEERIKDYRTWVSGVEPYMLNPKNGAISFHLAKQEVHKILKDKVIVGHSLEHDFQCLDYKVEPEHETKRIRDLARFPKYKNQFGQTRSLKKLTEDYLNR
jgi:RNA exonuclease 4